MHLRFLLISSSLLLFPLWALSQNRIGTGQVVDLYRPLCASCHGENLEGGLGGSLLGDMDYAKSDAEMKEWIREGNLDMGMPSFGAALDDAEIRSLVIYIREMQQKENRSGNPPAIKEGEPIAAGGYEFLIETVTEKVSAPWSIAFLPDGGFLVTEKGGTLRVVKNGEPQSPVDGIPQVWQRGQGGLLEVALHPDYEENGWVYLSFAKDGGDGTGSTCVARGRIVENRWVDGEILFEVPEIHHNSRGVHFGSRFVFKNGYVFFSIGDRGEMEKAQDLSSPHGKIHRIHDDGRIPDDNPFRNDPEAFPTIWTYGNRNPQGLDMHPITGEIWESEHGPRGGDEINRITKGTNYGWPVITHGMNYNGRPITGKTEAPGMAQPILYWTPSIAVCGIDFYEGDLFPEWKNNLFAGGLSSEELHRLVIEDDEIVADEIILKGIGRIRDIASGPDGALYLVLNGPNRIVRLVPSEN